MRSYLYKLSPVILSCLLVLSSCTKLDEVVYSQVPVENFGTTPAQLDALVGPIYSSLKTITLDDGSYLAMVELSSDLAVIPIRTGGDWNDGGAHKQMTQQSWTANSTYYNTVYDNASASVSLCNQIYYQINTSTAVSPANKERYLSEIRGIRAFWYYILCDNYGNIPIVTDFLDKSLPATKSRKEVYAFIISELNDIKDKLRSDIATPSSYGKMTKGVAYTLLAKMYLNAMQWNPEAGAKWQECADACDSVMALPYVIEPNWKTNFIPHNEVSKEAIFSAAFKAGGSGTQNNVIPYTLHYLDNIALGLLVSPYNGIAAMPDFVKSFDPADIRFKGSFLTGPMIDPATGLTIITAQGRPLIHAVDIVMQNPDADGWGTAWPEAGARCIKWEPEPGLSSTMENDMHIFRLADVYLMKAEALAHLGSIADATDLVNVIRARAFPGDNSKLLSNATLDDIRKERRFELAWEGYERQDMIRFGKFLLPKPGFKPNKSDPKYLLFPIPQVDIDANNKLVQNPGYN